MEAQMGPEGQRFYHALQSQKMKRMDSKKPVRNLSEKIHSLLGFKEQLTSNWVSAVRSIIKSLPSSEGSPVDLEPPSLPENDSTDTIDVDLGTSISKIKDELAALTLHINQLNIQRRQVLNDLLDLKGNIRVFCRIRPISVGENFGRLRPVVALGSSNVLLKLADHKSKSYSFDKVFHPGSSQDEVFSEVEPVIKSALDGYNACIFAYGQTGTGKTFTMEGTPDFPGVVPRAIEALFNQAVDSNHAFLFSFSMLEIYLGNLRDLLVPQPTKLTDPMPPCLSIQTDPKGGIEIENLVAIQVSDFNQVLRLYRLGCRFRSTASTNSNMTSSRSHCMIRISITCFNAPERRRETNKVWLVDLGGSERVLKTKASGKRLEEGKAINLSLSALGDVINALQRRKGHIPYRNSKLTQVLKDSLGEDSKTLMLVHVSPKEDDLCETICSLNFAARARSIHLGRMDSTEIREQKNFTMMNLQQNLKKIEDERQDVRSNIQKLNQKLENLTRTTSSSSEKLEEFHYSIDAPHYNPKNNNEEVKSAPSSQLPRFMRPTVCSRRKSGTAYQISGEKNPVPSRRRPASQCAASVTFPVKVYSQYTTASTISRTSCLTSLNKKCTADNETEYSQEASECDIKTVVSVEQETSRSTCHPNTLLGQTEKFCRSTNKYNSNKFHKVDNWLHLQKIPPTLSMHKSKRILAVPAPEKKHRCNQGEKVYKLCSEKVCEPTMKEAVNHDMVEIPETRGSGSSESEVMIDKPQTLLKEFFDKASKSNSISPWHATEYEITVQNQELADGQSIEKNKLGTFSQPSVCSIPDNEDNNQVPRTYTVQDDESQCSEDFAPYDNRCHHSSPFDLHIVDQLKENFGLSVTNPELVSCCQQLPSDTSTEDGVKEDMNGCSQNPVKEARPRLKKLRSQRALFTDNPNEESMTMTFVEGNIQNTGICYLLKEKIQIFSGSVLLGLGFQSLGFNHDFYDGLLR